MADGNIQHEARSARRSKAATDEDEEGLGRAMTFGEHLDELRSCLKVSVLAFIGALIVCMSFQDWLTEEVAVWPYEHARAGIVADGGADPGPLQAIEVTERFFFYFRIAMYGALLLAAPVFLHQMWRFIGAGLYARERRAVMRVLPASLLLFAAGVAFGFFLVVPMALRVLVAYGNADVMETSVRAENYLGFFLFMCLILGGVFQLPLVQVVLARFGLVSAATMSAKRRFFILGAVVGSAILTPTGDAVTLAFVAGPILVLYELGILVARRVGTTA